MNVHFFLPIVTSLRLSIMQIEVKSRTLADFTFFAEGGKLICDHDKWSLTSKCTR